MELQIRPWLGLVYPATYPKRRPIEIEPEHSCRRSAGVNIPPVKFPTRLFKHRAPVFVLLWRIVAPLLSGGHAGHELQYSPSRGHIFGFPSLPISLLPGLIPPSVKLFPPLQHIWATMLDDLQQRSAYPRDTGSRPIFYQLEKDAFAGFLLGAILYGISEISPSTRPLTRTHFVCLSIPGVLIVVFFQCMATLLNPVHRRGEGIKWGLVAYTMVMFSFVTVYTGVSLHIQSISFIDNREFTYLGAQFGPLGYQSTIRRTVIGMFPTVMFVLNYWLADGLLVSFLVWCRIRSPRCLILSHIALPMLRDLRQEHLGHHHPLPPVHRFFWYAYEFSTGRRR